MNKVILLGRLVREPELKTTPNGMSVCRISVAVQRKFKNADGGYDTDFINCTAFKNTAEFISTHFKKGQQIVVCGSLQVSSYEKNGEKRYLTDVVVNEAEFAGSKPNQQNNNNQTDESVANIMDGFIPMPNSDDLPF